MHGEWQSCDESEERPGGRQETGSAGNAQLFLRLSRSRRSVQGESGQAIGGFPPLQRFQGNHREAPGSTQGEGGRAIEPAADTGSESDSLTLGGNRLAVTSKLGLDKFFK